MKKLMILLAAMAMTTLAVQANDIKTMDAVTAMETEAPAPTTDGDTNGTTEEAAPEGK